MVFDTACVQDFRELILDVVRKFPVGLFEETSERYWTNPTSLSDVPPITLCRCDDRDPLESPVLAVSFYHGGLEGACTGTVQSDLVNLLGQPDECVIFHVFRIIALVNICVLP